MCCFISHSVWSLKRLWLKVSSAYLRSNLCNITLSGDYIMYTKTSDFRLIEVEVFKKV